MNISASKKLSYIPALDGLRGIAVLAVLLYHFFGTYFVGGFIGVDIFFVLSGFLITSLLIREWGARGTIDLKDFWKRRAKRILPAATVTVVLSTAIAGFFGGDITTQLVPQFFGSLFFVNNWVQIAQSSSYFSSSTAHIFGHYWSLGVEEQFYLFFPLISWGLIKIYRNKKASIYRLRRYGIIAAALACFSALLMAINYDPHKDPSRLYFGTDTHSMGLFLGVALACVLTQPTGEAFYRFKTEKITAWCTALSCMSMAVLMGMIVWMPSTHPFTYEGGLFLASLMAALFIFSSLYSAPIIKRIIGNKVLVAVGKISFSLYLWHWPVYIFLLHYGLAHWLTGIIATVMSIVVAFLSWRYIEKPMRGQWNLVLPTPEYSARTHRLICTCALMSVLGILSLLLVARTLIHAETKSSLELYLESMKNSAQENNSAITATEKRGVWALEKIQGTDMLAVGDSVMLASADALFAQFPGIYIDAAVSRATPAAEKILEDMNQNQLLRPVIILGLGTNDEIHLSQIEHIMDIAGPDRLVIMTIPFGDRPWIPLSAHVIKKAQHKYPNLYIADWAHNVEKEPEVLAWDGIHPDKRGAHIYAQTIREAFKDLPVDNYGTPPYTEE